MIMLNGNNLGERQKQLNEKVKEAFNSNASLCTPDSDATEADIDIVFNIDVASKRKNMDYIFKILTSGDNLYIKRALKKCTWLGDVEFANLICPDILHNLLFPHMSIKMSKDLLSYLSMYIKQENRSVDFYKYCMNVKLYNLAMKFSLNTPDSFKADIIREQGMLGKFYNFMLQRADMLKYFIANSFYLANLYLETIGNNSYVRQSVLYILRDLYSLSDVQYLDIIEKFLPCESQHCQYRLGNRISKDIVKKHKDRVLRNPVLYVTILHEKMLIKNSTVEDVKYYAVGLLPQKATDFWHSHYYKTYKSLLDLIPAIEKFSFIKQIFTAKYVSEPFETNILFYQYKFDDMMTSQEKEEWALRQLASGEELLGSGNDYIWYKFINFEKAFKEIKKIVLITSDSDMRLKVMKIWIDSAKTQKDIEILLNHYYIRHINELKQKKQSFLNKIIAQHNVLKFNEECWAALEKIFYSLEVFNKLNYDKCYSDYRVLSLLYYILRKNYVLDILKEYIDMDAIPFSKIKDFCFSQLSPNETDIVCQYMLQFFSAKVESLSKEPDNDGTKDNIIRYIRYTLKFLLCFDKKDSIPAIMNKYITLYWEDFSDSNFFEKYSEPFTENHIKKFIKTDADLAIQNLAKIKLYVEKRNTNWLIQKLNIYFRRDYAQKYVDQLIALCNSSDELSYKILEYAVYGIFNLAEESLKIELVEKYVPESSKIEHEKISQKQLYIQRAICTQACFSRPRLPLNVILQYVTGDYVQYCLPMFNSYLMNLSRIECTTFVEAIIYKPISIQKHGVRMAFQCFSIENLATLINDVWMKIKNVSMRKVIYTSLFDKTVNENNETRMGLFEILKKITLTLHQDDAAEIFSLLVSDKMPNYLKGQYLVTGWEVVKTFPERIINIKRMEYVIYEIENCLHLVPEEALIIITDEHVSDMLEKKLILKTDLNNGMHGLNKAKWNLIYSYLVCVSNEEKLQRNLKVVKHIIKRCIEMWNVVRNDNYVMRIFFSNFINEIETKCYQAHEASYPNFNIMIKTILQTLQDFLPEKEIYSLTWQLRISELARAVIIAGKQELKNKHDGNAVKEAIKIGILRFAEGFGELIKEYIESGRYFSSFHNFIADCVRERISSIRKELGVRNKLRNNFDDVLDVTLCMGLLKFKIPEVYMFISKFLPTSGNNFNNQDLQEVVRKVKSLDNTEIQYYMYSKFERSGYIVNSPFK